MASRPSRGVVYGIFSICILCFSSQGSEGSNQAYVAPSDGLWLRQGRPRRGLCNLRSQSEPAEPNVRKAKRRSVPFPEKATTFVETMSAGSGKSLVEIGCTNAKREFVVDQHMLGLLPERAENRETLGTIKLVGAGPGDPDLLTVAAVKAIKAADLVVADRLVSQEILSMVECELKVAQKHPGCAIQAQNEIYRW